MRNLFEFIFIFLLCLGCWKSFIYYGNSLRFVGLASVSNVNANEFINTCHWLRPILGPMGVPSMRVPSTHTQGRFIIRHARWIHVPISSRLSLPSLIVRCKCHWPNEKRNEWTNGWPESRSLDFRPDNEHRIACVTTFLWPKNREMLAHVIINYTQCP